MENKKFLRVYIPLLFLALLILVFGITNTLRNVIPGYEICLSKGLRFMKEPVSIEKEQVIRCRGGNQVFCFNRETEEEVECKINENSK